MGMECVLAESRLRVLGALEKVLRFEWDSHLCTGRARERIIGLENRMTKQNITINELYLQYLWSEAKYLIKIVIDTLSLSSPLPLFLSRSVCLSVLSTPTSPSSCSRLTVNTLPLIAASIKKFFNFCCNNHLVLINTVGVLPSIQPYCCNNCLVLINTKSGCLTVNRAYFYCDELFIYCWTFHRSGDG